MTTDVNSSILKQNKTLHVSSPQNQLTYNVYFTKTKNVNLKNQVESKEEMSVEFKEWLKSKEMLKYCEKSLIENEIFDFSYFENISSINELKSIL